MPARAGAARAGSNRTRGVRLFELPANRLLLMTDEFAYPTPDDFEIAGRY